MNEMQVWASAFAFIGIVILVVSLACEEARRAARWEYVARELEKENRELRRHIHWSQPNAQIRAARQGATVLADANAPQAAPLGNGAASDGATVASPKAVRLGRRY